MKTLRIGIMGGRGRVGSECLDYLLRETSHDIVIGGRTRPEEESLWNRDGGRVSFLQGDLTRNDYLAGFCGACDIVVNCAGPSALIKDRVALAALEQGAHYVDPGGHNPLYHALTARRGELEAKRLIFVLATGILPGLSELFPIHETGSRFDVIDSLDYQYIGRDRWTRASAYDIAWGVGNIGHGEASLVYENGQPKEVNLLTSGITVRLPPPLGKQKLYPVFREELREFVEKRGIRQARVHGNNWGLGVSLATILVRLAGWYKTERQLWQSAGLIARGARWDLRGKAPGFMLHLVAQGSQNGRHGTVTSTLFLEDTYRATGICAGIAARMVAEGSLAPGRFWASQLPDAGAFMRLFLEQGYVVEHGKTGEQLALAPEGAA
ncbi:MAG: saccharopine dehydrogenase NADP-binding domain-containing protein [Desulfocurvibacter africanus]